MRSFRSEFGPEVSDGACEKAVISRPPKSRSVTERRAGKAQLRGGSFASAARLERDSGDAAHCPAQGLGRPGKLMRVQKWFTGCSGCRGLEMAPYLLPFWWQLTPWSRGTLCLPGGHHGPRPPVPLSEL